MTMETMRAILIRDWADPQVYSVSEVSRPRPAAGEIVFAVDTAAVNFGDTLISTGRYQVKPILPFVPGSEASGVVSAVGEGVNGFRIGDRIAACGFIGNARIDRRIVGAFAEYACIAAANAVRLPDSVSMEDAALFRSNTETSAFALHKGRLAAGETMLVLGAGGGTGFAAIELGKIAGARVIASASSEEKRAIALAARADVAIDSRAADWRDQVKAITGGRGIDMVYDPVGGAATEQAFRALAWNGRLVVVGFAAGLIPALPTNLALLKGASLVGANLLEAQRHEPDFCAAEARRLMMMFGRGQLSVPPVARRYPLDQAGRALADVASGEVAGRVVVKVHG